MFDISIAIIERDLDTGTMRNNEIIDCGCSKALHRSALRTMVSSFLECDCVYFDIGKQLHVR